MKTIAVVDDDPMILRILCMTLESAGFRVESARNAQAFLDAASHQQPDLLITDIEMPGMGGKELCFEIERRFPDRQFPIVVLSSRTALDHRQWTREIPQLHFMEKPVSARRLLTYVNESLGITPATQEN